MLEPKDIIYVDVVVVDRGVMEAMLAEFVAVKEISAI